MGNAECKFVFWAEILNLPGKYTGSQALPSLPAESTTVHMLQSSGYKAIIIEQTGLH
jgi:hypothetical protein